MIKFHKIWVEECKAAHEIRAAFGAEQAIDYLIGEKLVNFVSASDCYPEFAQELPKFVAEAKRIFPTQQILSYFQGRTRRIEREMVVRVRELLFESEVRQDHELACC